MDETKLTSAKLAVQRLFGVSSGTVRSPIGDWVKFFGFIYLFLWVPDIDSKLLSILHHRSIITHSLLPALLFVFLGRRLGLAPIAGALIGTSVHLSCDLLSPMVGFGQIWLPAPIKTPLGNLSYAWLAGNAVVGFALASLISCLVFPPQLGFWIVALSASVAGATYGAFNEGSVLSIIAVLVIVAISLYPEHFIRKRWGRPSNTRRRDECL